METVTEAEREGGKERTVSFCRDSSRQVELDSTFTFTFTLKIVEADILKELQQPS